MMDQHPEPDRAIAAFMSRVAEAHGCDEAVPDPTLIWLKARLEQRLEQEYRAWSARLFSFKLILIAVALSALVAFRWTLPVLLEFDEVAMTTGISLAAVVPLIWFLGLRPLRNAR
jgi:hypothetical protein